MSFMVVNWGEVYTEVFANPLIGNEHWNQIKGILLFSFRIAAVTVLVDVIFGIPLSYILARKEFPGKGLLENLVMLPLVIPTSAFGFATLITWTTSTFITKFFHLNGGFFEQGFVLPFLNIPLLILIVHVTLTFPYVVRVLQSKLEDLNPELEVVSETLGATDLTTFRKVIFPLSLPGLFSGSVLAFARSLGETGATMVVAGVSITAPIAIVKWEQEFKIAPASFLGFLLILVATIIILPIEYFVSTKTNIFSFKLPKFFQLSKKVLGFERTVSKRFYWAKEVAASLFLILTILLPLLLVLGSVINYWNYDPYTGKREGSVLYQLFGPSNYFSALMRATSTSFLAAFLSTYVSTCLSLPTVMLIERFKGGRVLRSLLKIPLVVPTSTLGLSMLLLWGPNGLNLVNPGIWLIILTHIVFSVPVITESILSSYEGSNIQGFEEVARTLGASPYDAVETVTVPTLKRGILTGAVLSFTHSLGETGATFMVMGRDLTVSTLVVNMVEALAIPAALFSSTYLIALSLILLLLFKFISSK